MALKLPVELLELLPPLRLPVPRLGVVGLS